MRFVKGTRLGNGGPPAYVNLAAVAVIELRPDGKWNLRTPGNGAVMADAREVLPLIDAEPEKPAPTPAAADKLQGPEDWPWIKQSAAPSSAAAPMPSWAQPAGDPGRQ